MEKCKQLCCIWWRHGVSLNNETALQKMRTGDVGGHSDAPILNDPSYNRSSAECALFPP